MRRTDWRARLAEYVEASRRTPFRYGHHDCAIWAAGAVEAMTGDDHSAGVKGRYSTRAGGLKAVRKAGFLDVIDMVRAHYEEVPPALAQVGDVAVIDTPDGPALGVVQGPGIFVLRPEGLGIVGLLDAQMAFRI